MKFLRRLRQRRENQWWKHVCECAHGCDQHHEMVGACKLCDCPRFRRVMVDT